ncbi:hypothetical protein G6F57_023707 [Rhizopus arrhizus]|nr:hypothetical protein G6F57_023707 [Rhizopus arrhizus]
MAVTREARPAGHCPRQMELQQVPGRSQGKGGVAACSDHHAGAAVQRNRSTAVKGGSAGRWPAIPLLPYFSTKARSNT